VDLRCKVFRAANATSLEGEINRFLSDTLPEQGDVQFEEITQSEGPDGVTVVLWYSLVDHEAALDELEGPEELEGEQPKELA
jgi:hypothetical protein